MGKIEHFGFPLSIRNNDTKRSRQSALSAEDTNLDRRKANKPRDSWYRLQFRQYHRLFTQSIIKKHTIIYRQVSHAISAKDLPFI